MIGRVLFEVGGAPAVATLEDDGTWTVKVDHPDNETVNRILADDFNLDFHLRDYSPADGQYGYKQLHLAAERWRGRVEAPEPPEPTPGVVY